MSKQKLMDENVRNTIIATPEVILEDQTLMDALILANEQAMGENIVDLRGIAMERLTSRLDRLEDTHRSVIAAAYDNLAGTNQVNRAVLRLLDATKFNDFLHDLSHDVADILRVDAVRLVLETEESADESDDVAAVLAVRSKGFVDAYVTRGRDIPSRQVTLRQTGADGEPLYRDKAPYIRSEACLRLDFGDGRLPGMLLFGSEDPHLFTPQQGTDLMTFFAGVFERTMRQWLG